MEPEHDPRPDGAGPGAHRRPQGPVRRPRHDDVANRRNCHCGERQQSVQARSPRPTRSSAGINTTGLANHQTRGRHNRQQEMAMRSSMMDALGASGTARRRHKPAGRPPHAGAGSGDRAWHHRRHATFSRDLVAIAQQRLDARQSSHPGVGLDPGSNGGGTPGRMWMANRKAHGNLSSSIRVANVAAALNSGMVDIGTDSAPIVLARHFADGSKSNAAGVRPALG